ncbi:unnamed protein product, partial [Rotaria sp. Silwood2]
TYLRCLPSSVDDRGKSVIVSMLALTEQRAAPTALQTD